MTDLASKFKKQELKDDCFRHYLPQIFVHGLFSYWLHQDMADEYMLERIFLRTQ